MSAPETVLARILAETRSEVARRREQVPEAELRQTARRTPASERSLIAAMSGPEIAVIAEFKRRSPSAGALAEDPQLPEIVSAYERGGAAAASILTEGPNFGGSLEDLTTARGVCGLPLLRKDFVVDDYQLLEARAAGADAVLLIVAALSADELRSLQRAAGSLGLEVLVEVHDQAELEAALSSGALLVGINNRDLRDFTVDIQRTERLMGDIPDGITVVSESGISEPEQLQRLQERGVAGVLVGTSLMRSKDPARALAALRSAGRQGAGDSL